MLSAETLAPPPVFPQKRTRGDSGRADPAAGRVCGNPAAGRHPLPQRAREWGAAGLGVHATAAVRRPRPGRPCPSDGSLVPLRHWSKAVWTSEIDSQLAAIVFFLPI